MNVDRLEPTTPLVGCGGMLAGRVFQKPCFKHLQRFGAPMFCIPERLPKAISLDNIKSLEYKADRIELSLTRKTTKQHDREVEPTP
jgi:hypothetical protein